jgi:hypothetical protein
VVPRQQYHGIFSREMHALLCDSHARNLCDGHMCLIQVKEVQKKSKEEINQDVVNEVEKARQQVDAESKGKQAVAM